MKKSISPEKSSVSKPSKAEVVAALKELALRCDGEEGERADGSNIQTIRAHAILERLGE